jgi:hypothetical protein
MMEGVPTRERLRTIGERQAAAIRLRLAEDARTLRVSSGVSRQALASTAGVSRDWLADLERGRLRTVDLGRAAVVFACLGQKLNLKAYPNGNGLRDAAQLRLLDRFNARLHPRWRRVTEAVMPIPGDMRAWDELLIGPVRIGVEAETRLVDLEAIDRRMAGKQRDSGVQRRVLLGADTRWNREVVRSHIAALRQTYPLDTRATLAALAGGHDPGANGLVLL